MRRLSISLLLVSALMLGASCSDDNENQDGLNDGTASLIISLKGQPTSRSIGPSAPAPKVESVVSNFTVFVFNYNSGDLEKSKSFTIANGLLSGEITNLSTGTQKRIAVLVNVPATLNLDNIKMYSDLNKNLVTLESQNGANLETVGLFMSGETPSAITLSSTDKNEITIPVSRRVAKVILKSLKITPNPADIPNFSLTDVSVQKARVNGTALGGIVQPTGNAVTNYAGGIESPQGATTNFNLTYAFLSENLTIPAGYTAGSEIISSTDEERYFYILPNDGSTNNPTLLTLSGTYGSTKGNAYYPFLINGTIIEGSTDGTFIQSNKIYSISVIMNHPETPSDDPNLLPSEGTLNVTITPQDWETRIEQNVEW